MKTKINVFVVLILYLIIAILFCSIPLFNYLGYEFSFAISILSSVFSGILTLSYLKNEFKQKECTADNLRKSFFYICILNVLLLIVPFVIIIVNASFVKNCSFFGGVQFYLLLPVVTVVFSVSLSSFLFILIKKRRLLIYFIIWFIIIFYSASIYYFYPQIFLYNPIGGYFPGLIWDEELHISVYLFFYRLSTLFEALLFFSAGLAIAKYSKKEDRLLNKIICLKNLIFKNRFSLSLIVLLFLYWFFQNEFRVIISENYIQNKLGGKISTDHFIIYYSSDSFNEESIKKLAMTHEYYYNSISNQLKTSFTDKIESYIYPSSGVKNDLIGARNTNLAKPWLRQIHINSNILDNVLKHELVHVIAGEFGAPLINAGTQAGVIEGLAMAIEWDYGTRTLHQYASQLLKMNRLKNIDEILTNKGFAGQFATYSYVVSGSFCKFIIDKYGIDNFKRVYSWSNFKAIYQKDLLELNNEWVEYLKNINTQVSDSSIVNYLFKRQPIFQKVCARVIANINQQGWRDLNNKNFVNALERFRESLSFSNSSDAQQGLIMSYFQTGNYDSVINFTDKVFYQSSEQDLFLPYRLHRGDAFWLKALKENNKIYIDSALSNYGFLIDANIDDNLSFSTHCRIEIFKDSNIFKTLNDYYIYRKDEFTKAIVILNVIVKYPFFQIGKIILAKTLFAKNEYRLSLDYLSSIIDSDLNDYFKFEKYRLLGINNFNLNNYKTAKDNFLFSINFQQNEATINRINEWIQKCDFFEKYKL